MPSILFALFGGTELLKGVLGVLSAAVIAAIGIYAAWKKNKFGNKDVEDREGQLHLLEEFQQLFETSEIVNSLKAVVESTDYKKAMIFVAHNSDGPIGLEYLTKTSCLFSETDRTYFKENGKDYINTVIDIGYWEVLLNMLKQQKIVVSTEKLNDSLLKNIYLTDGVKNSEIIYLSHVNTIEHGVKKVAYIYYMVLAATTDITKVSDPEHRRVIDMSIGKIKLYYKKYFNNTIQK